MNIRVVNLSTYTSPDIRIEKNKDWVTFGPKNSYFQYLIDRYTGSPTNNAVIKGFSQLIYGKGLDATDSSVKPDEYAQMINLFKKDCTRKLVNDLKLMGQCAIQVIYSKDRKTIAQVEHMPVETLAMEKCDDEGVVNGYYYHPDWSSIKPNEQPERIPAFGTSKEPIEILYVKPYVAGFYYFSPVDYQGGLQYANLEEEISNYHMSNIKQGLNPSMILNFNNGVPNEEERDMIEQRVADKFAGSSNAGRFILAFNESAETAATIEPVPLSDAHNQYQFLSDESMRKIMIAHGVVSPMLLGIKDQTGLGNNADELKTASTLMDNTVIRPFQTLLLDAFDQILAFNNIALNLYFKTLQPLEFQDLSNVTDKETREEETGVKMSLATQSPNITDETLGEVTRELLEKGEDIDLDEWELISEGPAMTDESHIPGYFKFASSVIKSSPRSKSEQDTSLFKIRYKYVGETGVDSRDFCKKMIKANKVYRYEDLQGDLSNNPGFGPNGSESYSIWLYKGGPNCHHSWLRQVYLRKNNQRISVGKARKMITDLPIAERDDARYVQNPIEVATPPFQMPNAGYLNPR